MRSIRPTHLALAGAVLAFSHAATVDAAYIATLDFVQPTGIVGPNDAIDVRVRLTLDPGSDALLLDPGEVSPPFGVPLSNWPTQFEAVDEFGNPLGNHVGSFVSLEDVFFNTYFVCEGTFTTSCSSGPPYDFSFNVAGPESINYRNDVQLLPGESLEYVFGTFTPTGGAAPPGTYNFYRTGLTLNFRGAAQGVETLLDENGDPVPVLDEFGDPVYDENGDPVYETVITDYAFARGEIHLAATCPVGGGPACVDAFTRTTVVPLPATALLLGSAVSVLGVWRRKRIADKG